MRCHHTSAAMERIARRGIEKLIYSEVYICLACGARMALYRPFLSATIVNNYRFIFSRYSRCLSCGSEAVARNNRVYFLSKNPLGWIQWLAGAPLWECSPCGRQYFDWRAPHPRPIHDGSPTQDSYNLAALSRAIPRDAQTETEPERSSPTCDSIAEKSARGSANPSGTDKVYPWP
jgi:hypothetical protein